MSSKNTTFLALIAATLTLVAGAVTATAAPLVAPANGETYNCLSGTDWQTIRFDLPASPPNFRRGKVYINGDNKKADLAKPVNGGGGSTSWEFTLPRDNFQCKALNVREIPAHGGFIRSILSFDQCSDGRSRTCVARFRP